MTTEYDRERSGQSEAIEEAEGPHNADAVEEQDFALRNTMMSNALPNSAQPAAGAIVGAERADTELGMQPETDEELFGADEDDRAAAIEADAERRTETGTDI